MRILLYGGTFNPPHIGHVAATKTAWERLGPDKLIWMPSNDPPHKALAPGTPDAAHRLEMCRLSLPPLPGAEVSDLELRTGLRYTLDTADALSASLPGADITVLIGADMLMSLHLWHRAPELLARYPVAALARSDGGEAELLIRARELEISLGARVAVLPHAPVDISSSELRALLRRGEGREYLAAPVYAYIAEHGLYQ